MCIYAFSGVLVSIGDQWLVVTAGRCIELVEQALRQGYEFKRCCLLDSMDSNTRGVVFFDWASSKPWFQYDERSGADDGALFIGGHTQRLLAAEGKLTMGIGTFEPGADHWFAIYGYPEFASLSTEERLNQASYAMVGIEQRCQMIYRSSPCVMRSTLSRRPPAPATNQRLFPEARVNHWPSPATRSSSTSPSQ